MSGQCVGVRPRTSDLVDRMVSSGPSLWITVSCGDGCLHGCLGTPVMS
jgi:hypothetical protein